MAKAPKNTAAAEPSEEALVVPAPMAAAVEEQDTVLQAHFTRQANHFSDLAPSIAKQARDDAEREAMLQEQEVIAERNRKEREAQRLEQEAREKRENAAATITRLEEEIASMEAALADKKADLAATKKLIKEA